MGNGDAIAEACRTEFFPGDQAFVNGIGIQLGVLGDQLADQLQHTFLRASLYCRKGEFGGEYLTYLHGSLLELSVIDALLAANGLFLVFDQLAIEAIDQLVDGGIHIGVLRFGNQVGAGDVQRTFGLLLEFVHLKGYLGADDLVEVALQAAHLFGYVVAQSIGYIKLETSNLQLHNTSPDWLKKPGPSVDRKSTRLNSSHVKISYAGFCLKKKKSRARL